MAWDNKVFSRKKNNKTSKRLFSGAQGGRLFADWQTSGSSADQEIEGSLSTLRNRSRALARNDSYVSRYRQMMISNVIGPTGIRVASKARNDNGELDLQGNREVESAFAEWCEMGSCSADGKQSFLDIQKMFVGSLAIDGEVLIRHIRSKDNRFGYQLQML
jgi:capsid protein